ncbi:transposase [Bacillus toyonensis]|uniref:Tc1-like transposase DDE domain-containing protein n=2 Tax=Bacillus toyonensis TaxID=155322 RepID=A0A2B5Y1Y1_9BACI|nr:transposase [Bacillus toyonensis]PGB02625.1 hypothetical protein COL93_10500 [Bacillus toyonensis]PHD55893.1 hypothetical protein COF40_29905 [Bacillus toyonensis]
MLSCSNIEIFLRENNPHLTLLFLPPYSQNLNMIERIWRGLKENVLESGYHETIDHLMNLIYQFTESSNQNPKMIISHI